MPVTFPHGPPPPTPKGAPTRIGAYAKTVVAVLLAGVTALHAAISDHNITEPEWVGIAIAVITAVGVYAIPNKPYPDPDNPT